MSDFNLEKIDLNSFDKFKNERDDEQVKGQQLQATLSQAVKTDPDKQSSLNRLSRESGVPVDAVESDPSSIEQGLKLNRIDLKSLVKDSPSVSDFLRDYGNASIAHDDIEPLKNLESSIKETRNPTTKKEKSKDEGWFSFNKTFQNIGEAIGLAFKQQTTGLMLHGADRAPEKIEDLIPAHAMPFHSQDMAPLLSYELASRMGLETDEDVKNLKEEAINQWTGEIKDIQEKRQQITPEEMTILEEGVRAGVESLATMTPGLLLTLLSRGRALPMLATMGSQTYGDSYAHARSEGKTAEESAWFASVDAGIEVATEIIPAHIIGEILTGRQGLTKDLLRFAVADMAGEQAATLLQTANSYANGLDAQLENASTVQEMLDIQLRRQTVTAIATVVAGGSQMTVVGGINKTLNKMTAENQEANDRTEFERQALEVINQHATDSRLRQRDPESFRQFIENTDGDNNTHIFLDAAQLRLYLSERQGDDPALRILSEGVQQAASLGGSVGIPLADFATYVAGTEHFDALRDIMTLEPQTTPTFRVEDEQRQVRQYMDDLVSEAQRNATEILESQEIFESVRDQLVDSGIYSRQNARVIAEVVPVWVAAYAERNDLGIRDAYRDLGLRIEGPRTGRRQELESQLEEAQGEQTGIPQESTPQETTQTAESNDDLTEAIGQLKAQQEDEISQLQDSHQQELETVEDEAQIQSIKDSQAQELEDLKADHRDSLEELQRTGRLEQSAGEQTPKGYYEPANALIRLNESADLSTFLHEFAHFMYEMELKSNGNLLPLINNWFSRNSADVAKEATKYLLQNEDRQHERVIEKDVADYIEQGQTGSSDLDSAIRTSMHEQFSRGWES